MNRSAKWLQLSTSAAVLSAALVFPTAVGAATKTTVEAHAEWNSFLQQQYGVTFDKTVTREQFEKALLKIVSATTSISEKDLSAKTFLPASKDSSKLLVWEAVSAAAKAAELKELGYTYSEEKVATALKKAGISYKKGGTLTLQAAQELAVAVDTGLVSANALKSASVEGAVTAELASQLLAKVAEFHGSAKNYLGTIADEEIFGKLAQAWNESQIIKAGELQELVDKGLKQNLITGYNLKDAAFDPHFDPQRTITYGHSDIAHAIQLIALLKSEGVDAKVQFEPKTSAFIYLKEWGEPVQTADYQVVQIENGNYIAYAKEYDLSLEFDSVEAKKKFQPLVLKYAKRDQEDMTGLLKASWWQPLYHSRTELADYAVITNNVLKDGRYVVQSFSLNEESPKVVEGFQKLNAKVKVETYKFWVDQPFFHYLNGESK
ncbi:hypothetical protein BBR47_32420 [Brevibacillus brevis NBRC 100599]|uniref:SLH domain-containing protein n=1 Tax=Brevibacillus brevis (strain 47 / JCM 6285 / NBRC 100599) TaxID=358681 RepID=C0ZEL0_BREBN|nr:hypothetical protein [Brevibacillus brevis]BAH44219.1 hypothetical protein BBR47_32420 [Brevibacillus brevis NBRC 100599]